MHASAENGMRVGVIGAGIAGLACARELRRLGVEVVVFEKEQTVGGRMGSRVKDGLVFDTGANFLVEAYSTIHELARQEGVAIQPMGCVDHVFRRDGEWCRFNFSRVRDGLKMRGLGLASKMKFFWLMVRTRLRYPMADFFDLNTLPPELMEGSAYDFVKEQVSAEFADYVADGFCATMMFHSAKDICSGTFVALTSMMADRHADFSVQHPCGEMSTIPRAIAARLDVRTGRPVREVRRTPDGVRLDGELFDAVVLAATADASLAMLRDPTPAQAAVLEGTRYSATINVSFRIPAGLLGARHCFYVPRVESPLVSEFTNEAVKGDCTVRGGVSLVNAGLHENGALPLMDEPDDAIFATVLRELRRLCAEIAEAGDAVVPHDLQRWRCALPKYDAGHVSRVKRFWEEGQGEGAVFLCGDYMNTPWLEGAAICGERVAARVKARHR